MKQIFGKAGGNDGAGGKSRATVILAALGPALLLAGCVNLGAKPPPSLLVLTPSNKPAAGALSEGPQSAALVVLTPAAPRKLDSNRLPVQIDSSSIAYLKDAVWSDRPAILMQQLISETIAAKNGRFILSESDADGLAEEYLSGSLIEFGVDASSGDAVVIFDAVHMLRGQPARKRRFEARRSVSIIEAVPASAGLNGAANEVAADIADWMKN